MTPTKVLALVLPEREEPASRHVAVAVLLSLLIHALILAIMATGRWWDKPSVAPTSQPLFVSLLANVAPDNIPMTEVVEPVSQSDLVSPDANSSVGISPSTEDPVDPVRDISETNERDTPSEIINNTSVVNPLPGIDFDAAYRIAREMGRMSEAEGPGTGIYSDDGVVNSNEKIRLAVVNAWAPPPSCYRAYSGMGLFAIPFLLKDTFTDSGCEW